MGRREGEMKDKGARRCGINRSRTDGAICGGMKPGSGEGEKWKSQVSTLPGT